MTEVKWSYNQFEAYAKAFEEGDAVRAGGTWHEVVKDRKVLNESDEFSGLTVRGAKNLFRLNYNVDDRVEGVATGFTSAPRDKYEIVTLKDHEVKVGDKLVWLGEGYEHWSFGGVYAAYSDRYGKIVTYDGDGVERTPKSENWGIIPRYETVNAEDEMKTEMSEVSKKDEVGKAYPSKFLGKYSVGDEVVLSNGDVKVGDASNGARGVVLEVDKSDEFCPYYVKFEGDDKNEGADIIEWCNEAELDLIKSENVKEEEMNEKTELVDEVEYSGKFKVGDRVKVRAAVIRGSEPDVGRAGVISHVSTFGAIATIAPYQVDFDEGDHDFFNEAELELIARKEKSPEQEAFDYLLSRGKDAVRGILEEEVAIWAKVHFRNKDYDELRQAIDILERLEKEG